MAKSKKRKLSSEKERELSLNEMFDHLVYGYRYLATAAYAWKFLKNQAKDEEKNEIDRLIPEATTIIQDSLLLHARTLIEYYLPLNSKKRETDLHISDFLPNFSMDNDRSKELEEIKKQIEVHILHLTKWRDSQYRKGGDDRVQRPDWNDVNNKIFGLLTEPLEGAVKNLPDSWENHSWKEDFKKLKEDFKKLAEATKGRFEKGSLYNWPDFGGKEDISIT